MILEFLFNFVTTLVTVWLLFNLLPKMSNRQPQKKETVEINGLSIEKETVIYAEAEYIEQGSFKGWLVFEKDKNSFLAQGNTKNDCNDELRKKFPGKTFVITGFNGAL